MKPYLYVVKFNLLKQIRSYEFLLITSVSVFLGILCVPAGTAGYEVIYLGGVRGIYNSAWLGGVGALLPAILLWLPGFYLLRSQISEDKRLNIGSMIASTPISKFGYIMGKTLASFAVLVMLVFLFLIALIGMQLVRQEAMQIRLVPYVQPFLFLTAPYLFVLAAFTVLFDVLRGVKGTIGNIVIFGIWVTLLSSSILVQDHHFDLLGIGTTLTNMVQGAQEVFPEICSGAGSLGLNITNGISPTFAWGGMTWSAVFLLSRLTWIGVALLIVIVSAFLFDRFAETVTIPQRDIHKTCKVKLSHSGIEVRTIVSPVAKETLNLFRLAKGELNIMVSGCPVWWYLTALACIVLSLVIPFGDAAPWISLIMLLPIAIWSQMGCRETYFFTTEFVESSCPLLYKLGAEWFAGIGIAAALSFGILIRFAWFGAWNHFAAWMVGILFIPTLALTLGRLGGSRKLFEAIYIALFYFGPINGVPLLDFWGIRHTNIGLFAILTCALMALGAYRIQASKRRHGTMFNA